MFWKLINSVSVVLFVTISTLIVSFAMTLLVITLAYAHPADKFCPGDPYPPEYEQLGLVDFDPATPEPVHCEAYIPSLCHDDVEWVQLSNHYWHERRDLLDVIHKLDAMRQRSFAYAVAYSVRKKKPRIPVPTIDYEPFPDGYDTQRDFVDYWNRIGHGPEVYACMRWYHEGVWHKEKAISYLEDHVEAATYHKARALERIEVMKIFEPFFYLLAIKK